MKTAVTHAPTNTMSPIRPSNGFPEMSRLMALRKWRESLASCAPQNMSDNDRRLFNASIRIPLPADRQVFRYLQHAAHSGLTGTNAITWLQGQAGAGKTDLALEVAARFTDPDSVGAPALPSTTDIQYACIPIASISGQGDQIAGLARAGCRWFGIDPGRTGNESTDLLAHAITRCGTRVLIIEDLHAVNHINKDIDALRVLLNKVSAHVIMISLPPEQARPESVAAAIMKGSPPAQQILARTRAFRLSGMQHLDRATATRAIVNALGLFKLHGGCDHAAAIAQMAIEHSDHDRLRTLPLIFAMLRGLAVEAVGTTETISLKDFMRVALA